jgi:hypothetical protein
LLAAGTALTRVPRPVGVPNRFPGDDSSV